MTAADYTHALFDFADTLAELRPGREGIVSAHVERQSGIHIPPEAVARAYKSLDLLMHYSSVRTRTLDARADFYLDYNQRLLALLGVSHLVSAEGLFAAFGECRKHWELKEGARELLQALKARGLRIGVISNFDACLEHIVTDRLGLSGTIDHLHVSQVEGLEKPDPTFYLRFFEKHRIDIRRSFYIGDSYVLDFLPAKQIGLKAWLLDEAGLYAHCPDAIGRLGDILDLTQM